MKKTALILILSIIWAQTTSTNVSGLGEIQIIHDAASTGNGGSQFFSTQSNGFTLNSSSSLWKTKDVKLGFSTSFSNFSNKSGAKLRSNLLDDIFFITPVGENKAIAIGLYPHTRSNFYIKTLPEDGQRIMFENKIYTSTYTYHSNGGISSLFISYSQLLSNGFSFGLTWNKNFGNLFLTDSVQTYQIFTNSDNGTTSYSLTDISASKKTHRFSGNSFSVESRMEKDRHAIVVSTSWRSSLSVNTHFQSLVGNSEKDTHQSSGIEFSDIGGGFLYKPNEKTGITGELHYINPASLNANLFGISEKSIILLNSGFFRRFANSKLGNWDYINLSTGFYSIYHNYSIGDMTDFGLTFGLGFEYFNQKNVINIVVTTGRKSGLFENISNEKYINVKVGISTGEHWFVKRRRS